MHPPVFPPPPGPKRICVSVPPPPPNLGAGRPAGARGEALAEFPHVRRAAAVLAAEGPHAALLKLLAEVEDTNLLHRGGPEGLRFVREQAADILSGPAADRAPRLEALDDACIARNLSPGGSADLLAAAMLLEKAGRRMGSGW